MTYAEIRAMWKDIEPEIIQGIKDGLYSESYSDIVKNLAKLILRDNFSNERFMEIDWGEYQGTKIYVFASRTYQPDENDTYIVSNYYGSCSGCDQLLSITDYDTGAITDENTINDLLSLTRDIFERIRPLSNLQNIPSLIDEKSEINRLREALQEIVDNPHGAACHNYQRAKKALEV